MKEFFFLIGIFTNFWRCKFQWEILKKLIFINKNWPNDPRIYCKSPSSLVEFMEMDGDLEKGLEEFESSFERMKLWICEVVRNKYLLSKNILDKFFFIGKWLKKKLVWKKTWNISCA